MLALLLAATLAAPASPMDHNDRPSAAHPPVRAQRLASPVVVDGVLSEEVWRTAEPAGDFRQRDPHEGAPASQRTEVRVAFDDEALYVGARLWDTAPDSILARLTRRDVNVPADRFSLYLDPYHDRRSGYFFEVNAAGVLYDGTLFNDGWDDYSWDGVWQGRARRDAEGWTCEMRIPFSQLRFASGGEGVWGVNFRRFIQRTNENLFYSVPPKNESGFVSRFPHLVGLDGIRPRRSVEIVPYVTGKAEFLNRAAGDPFHDGSETAPNAGVDLRTSLGPRLTLNATVNPDFGQVEVDPAIVNLSDVESYFDEKRPFFVEGSQIFRFGNEGASDYWGFDWPEPQFFYPRRLGRAPQGSPPDADHVDAPLATTILGAAKVTGKLGPGWNFGTLHAVTSREEADFASGAGRGQVEIEPLTYYGMVRAQKEFPERRHGLGLMTTLAGRHFEDPALASAINRTALVAGLDGWSFLDRDKTWVVSYWAAMSHVTGTAERIAALQRSSRHYFQRPDADHLTYDPSATSLTGGGARAWLNKERGRAFSNSAIGFMTPSFDVNDMGFHTRSDVINAHAGGGYKWTTPGRFKKYQHVLGALFGAWDFGGHRTGTGVFVAAETEFNNNVSAEARATWSPRTLDNRRTRGGPLTESAPGFEVSAYADTDGKRTRFYYLDLHGHQQPEANSYSFSIEPGIELKPVSNVTLGLGPELDIVRESAQYVMTGDADPTATATFGRRYVFARLDQRTFSANVRLNVAFTPALSLQLYAQPLVSSGAYADFKELARARSDEYLVYGTGGSTLRAVGDSLYADPDGAGPAAEFLLPRPDFNFKSLRGNAVLRWEYRPGSTLFLVWTQERLDFEPLGEFRLRRSLDRLIDREPENIFLAKVTWHLSP
uniref:Carbohydrate binding family 9 domain-containing protein n=1 Tax=Eiseniibacteriota bacterium TaxID=2212470 RepID=A0A832HZY6_UNCEI